MASARRRPRPRRWPTATRAHCCCATAAHRSTPRGSSDREDLPRLVRAGRHIARTRRYIRNYAHEVEPEDLTAYVAAEAQRGDGWVKLVGDWIEREAGDLKPSFPAEAFAAAIETAHAHGAKVTAHCFGEEVLPMLIDAGIDCIEHGTGLSSDLVESMVARGTALVPTVVNLNNFPDFAAAAGAKFPAYAEHMMALHAHRRETLMAAYDAGVAIYAGTDAGGVLPHGSIADEVRRAGRVGPVGRGRPRGGVVAGTGVAGPRAASRRGGARRLRRARRRPAGRPHHAAAARSCGAARTGRRLIQEATRGLTRSVPARPGRRTSPGRSCA